MAPLRRYTRGYTGNRAYALRPYEYNQSEMNDVIDKLRRMNQLQSASWTVSAEEYIQMIRGRLYVLTDSLMTMYENKKKENKKQELESILLYCEAYIAFACKRLEEFPLLAKHVALFHTFLSIMRQWLNQSWHRYPCRMPWPSASLMLPSR